MMKKRLIKYTLGGDKKVKDTRKNNCKNMTFAITSWIIKAQKNPTNGIRNYYYKKDGHPASK